MLDHCLLKLEDLPKLNCLQSRLRIWPWEQKIRIAKCPKKKILKIAKELFLSRHNNGTIMPFLRAHKTWSIFTNIIIVCQLHFFANYIEAAGKNTEIVLQHFFAKFHSGIEWSLFIFLKFWLFFIWNGVNINISLTFCRLKLINYPSTS